MTFDHCREQFNFCNSDSFFSLNQRIIRPSVGSSPLPNPQPCADEAIDVNVFFPAKAVDPPPELPRKPGVIKILGRVRQNATSDTASSANERKSTQQGHAAEEQQRWGQSSTRTTQAQKPESNESPMFEVTSDEN